MKNAKVTEVKQYLKTLNRDELEQLILKLYKNYKNVKNEISSIVLGEKYIEELLEDYKKKILKEINKRSSRFSIRTLNSYVSSFIKESGGNERYYTDLLLFYLEQLIPILEMFTYHTEVVDNLAIKLFDSILDLVKNDEELFKLYENRISAVWHNEDFDEYALTDTMIKISLDIPWISKEERDWLSNYQD